MFITHIYIETDSMAQRISEKAWGYVLECVGHEDKSASGFGRLMGTYHQATLTALGKALGRFNQNSEIHIHTRDTFILAALQADLGKWAGNGFQNARGEQISNKDEWEKVWKYSRRQRIVPEPVEKDADHVYSGWLRWEMEVQKGQVSPAQKWRENL